MKLLNLYCEDIKYSINNDGTLIIIIKDEYMIKISWGELRSLDMIISDQQSEALGIASTIIEKLKKGLDTQHIKEIEPPCIVQQLEESIFKKEAKEKFIIFLESYLSEDEETSEVFDSNEISSILGQEFLISELQEEFGSNYSFEELDDNRILITLLTSPKSN